mgnify:CR=1 FL=1
MMIEVKNLSFSYGKRKQKVFDDFSLTLDKRFSLWSFG